MKKSLVFISHITEEKDIASELKRLIESAFLNMIDVFVSSDSTSIKPGRKWLEEITYALKICAVEIVLASPKSVNRPWINFEGGSGWIRDIPVIPLCHSGMTPSKLPAPLNTLQAATATDVLELKRIMPAIAEAIGCAMPTIDYEPFISTVKKFEDTTRQIADFKHRSGVAPTDGLQAHELATLVQLGEDSTAPGHSIYISYLRNELSRKGFHGIAVSLAIKSLFRSGYIDLVSGFDEYENQYHTASITEQGWDWLEANQDKLILSVTPKSGYSDGPPEDASGEIPF